MYYALVLLAALGRVLPHPPNIAPIAALGLFAGAYGNRRAAVLVPLAGLLIADAFIGFYNPVAMAFVYGGYALSGLLGRTFLREKRTASRIGAASLAGSARFFVLSNLGIWVVGYYPHTWAGVVRCYVMAIPFLGNTLAGDLFYTAALFGLYEVALAQNWRKRLAGLAQ